MPIRPHPFITAPASPASPPPHLSPPSSFFTLYRGPWQRPLTVIHHGAQARRTRVSILGGVRYLTVTTIRTVHFVAFNPPPLPRPYPEPALAHHAILCFYTQVSYITGLEGVCVCRGRRGPGAGAAGEGRRMAGVDTNAYLLAPHRSCIIPLSTLPSSTPSTRGRLYGRPWHMRRTPRPRAKSLVFHGCKLASGTTLSRGVGKKKKLNACNVLFA